MTGRALVLVLALVVLELAPPRAHAQLFFASRPEPELTIGPLFVRASVTPDSRDVPVDVLFSVVVPSERSALEFEQPLYLLWPGAVATTPSAGAPDPAFAREVAARGVEVIAEGRLPLSARRGYEADTDAESVPEGAPFVTVVRTGGPLGLSAPATYIRIPWTPKLVNRAWLMDVRLTALGLVQPKLTSWVDRMVHGPRSTLALGWGDVGAPAMFAMYFGQRERVLALAHPSQLIVAFAGAGAVALDDVAPSTSRHGLSPSHDNTTVVSLFLERSEGLTPQVLSVDFAYRSRWQTWAPVLVPLLFFVLGNIAAVAIRHLAETVGARLVGRLQIGRGGAPAAVRERGIIIAREQLARIVPGVTTYGDVLRLCGGEAEESEGLAAPDHKTLVYRGRREVPQRTWTLGWLSRIAFWSVEHHEVTITIDDGVVRNVQASVRRARL